MSEQKKPILIFDTDMDTDCDDAGALAILLKYVRAERAELAGIIADAPDAAVPGTCELLCNYYGVKRPIGAVYADAYPAAETDRYKTYRHHRTTLPQDIYYNKQLTRLAGKTDRDYPAAARVYRELLAAAEDGSVTVLCVGFLTAVEELFCTSADEISPLTGLELFAKKVCRVVSMGCADYPVCTNYNFNYNMDRVGAKAFFDLCPAPIYVSPDGMDVITGGSFTEKLPLGHPLRTAYEIYNQGPNRGRMSWDLIALLFALEPERPIWRLESHGAVRYDDSDNHTYWQEDAARRDFQLRSTLPAAEMAALLEELLVGEV